MYKYIKTGVNLESLFLGKKAYSLVHHGVNINDLNQLEIEKSPEIVIDMSYNFFSAKCPKWNECLNVKVIFLAVFMQVKFDFFIRTIDVFETFNAQRAKSWWRFMLFFYPFRSILSEFHSAFCLLLDAFSRICMLIRFFDQIQLLSKV